MSWIKAEIAPGVTLVRVLNTTFKRFENFWPIPKGTSYNFYVVKGSEGVALIDGTDERVSDVFWEALETVVDPSEITLVVSQHTEPDHSGTLAEVMRRAPRARLVGTRQAIQIGTSLSNYPADRSRPVADGERISLGDRTLRFVSAPFVHWPDTMMTLLEEEGILFTCDLFGSHGASRAVYYDEDPDGFELRDYYSSILMVYSAMVAKAVAKAREISPRLIAPGHGALHRDVGSILKTYERWSSWTPL
ncbi:MAG: FprA family A-type flavoprotein, partial [Thermoproteota archaeon]